MRNLKTVGALAAGALAATALTGVAVATSAIADDETPTSENSVTDDSDTAADEAEREGHRGGKGPHGVPMGRDHGVLHGEMVVETEDGVYVTQQVQRGEVTAVSETSITVASEDGYSATYTIDEETESSRDREDAVAEIGDTAHVVATVDGSTVTAERIHAMSPDAVAEMEAQRDAMQEWMSQRPEGDGPRRPGFRGGERGFGAPESAEGAGFNA
jgi:hypothetical protein